MTGFTPDAPVLHEIKNHSEALAQAEAGVAAMAAERNNRWYPKFHIASNGGWINDPNGLCFYKGRWHVFYQLHPYGTQWGPMHWGHVSSNDMLNWKREPIMFAPTLEEEKDGVFSGSAVIGDDGELKFYYTGHRWANGIDNTGGDWQVQMIAEPDNDELTSATKRGMIIDCPLDKVDHHYRDPKVWKTGDKWYMTFGVSSAEKRGQMWLFSSDDMVRWTYERVLFEHPDPNVFMLECPDFFPIKDAEGNEKWVIGFSAMGAKASGFMNRNVSNAGYMIGTWTPGEAFQPETEFRLWDCGHNYYAPQSFNDGERQTVKMGKDKANTATGALNISLPLFAPAVYRAMSMTKTDIELAVEKSRASKQDLVNQVTKAYYQLMLSQDSYDVLQKSYKLAEDNYNIVNAKYRQGAVSEFDKISAEVQMRSVKPSVISAGNAVTLSKLQLKVLMGITADLDIKIDDSLAAYEGVVFANQLDNATHEGLVNNTTMKQLELNRLMLQKNIKSLRTNFMPTLALGYSYQYQSMNNDSWNVFNYNYGSSSSLVFSLSIPLYKASNFTKLKSNRIQMRQLDQNRIDTERKLNMQITSYQDNMAASSEQVSSNKENVMQAEKAVQIAGKRYEVGKGTVLELNTSQVQLTEAELTYNQSIYDYLVAKADLDQVLGRDYISKDQK